LEPMFDTGVIVDDRVWRCQASRANDSTRQKEDVLSFQG
jgi:hypothetical protein